MQNAFMRKRLAKVVFSGSIAGYEAMDKKCGSTESFAKETEATRVKLVAEVEKAHVQLLAEATAGLR